MRSLSSSPTKLAEVLRSQRPPKPRCVVRSTLRPACVRACSRLLVFTEFPYEVNKARVLERIEPTAGVRELIAEVHARGGLVGVVSGGFHEILDTIAPDLGVDFWRANRLDVSDGVLSGLVDGEIVDAEAKASTLRAWALEHDVPMHSTIAIGDGANDLRMMAAAGLGLAFNAKPAVRAQADLVIERVDLREVIALLP